MELERDGGARIPIAVGFLVGGVHTHIPLPPAIMAAPRPRKKRFSREAIFSWWPRIKLRAARENDGTRPNIHV